MSPTSRTSTPQARDRAKANLHRLTRAAILGAAGGATVIGIVVAREHPGSSSSSAGSGSAGSQTSAGSGASAGGSSSSGGDDGSTGNTGDTGNTGNTNNSGNQGASAPTLSPSRPSIVSGGTSR